MGGHLDFKDEEAMRAGEVDTPLTVDIDMAALIRTIGNAMEGTSGPVELSKGEGSKEQELCNRGEQHDR